MDASPPLGSAAVFGAYLVGCVCAGYYLVRVLRGEDLRSIGSGSAGGTNAARALGGWALPLVFLLDMAKGAAVAALALRAGLADGVVAAVVVAVVLGHVYPVQLGFRGGRGISPSVGALLVVDTVLVVIGTFVAGAALAVTRNRVRSGVAAYASLPLVAMLLGRSAVSVAAVAAVSLIVVSAHLRRGSETLPQGG